jgi:hypothetical protein
MERQMREDRHGQGLNDTHAERSTSSTAKAVGYGVIALLVIAIILLATGILDLGQP